MEGVKISISSSDTLSKQGFFATHAQYIKNLADGFNARFVADYSTRILGLLAVAAVTNGALMLSDLGVSLLKTTLLSSYFLIAKICVSPVFIGYAVIWPYVLLAMKKTRTSADFYRGILDVASNLLDNAVRYNNELDAKKAVMILKALYYYSGKQVSLEYQKTVNEFSILDAVSFNEFVKQNMPVSTKASSTIDTVLTIILGSWISTVLFDGVSSKVYDPNLTTAGSWELLGLSGLMLAGTYAGLKIADTTVKKVVSKVKDIIKTKDPKKTSKYSKVVDELFEDSTADIEKVEKVLNDLIAGESTEGETKLTRQELYNLVKTVEQIKSCTELFSKE